MVIDHITYYLPKERCSICNFKEQGRLSQQESIVFEKVMGLQYIARNTQLTTEEIIYKVMERFLQEYMLDSQSVKYLLFAHTGEPVSPDGMLLKKFVSDFRLKDVLYFGSSLYKCATAFHYILLSEKLLQNLPDNSVILLLIADTAFTSVLDIIPGATIMGDGAAIICLKKYGKKNHFIHGSLSIAGEFSQGVWGAVEAQMEFQKQYMYRIVSLIEMILSLQKKDLSEIRLILPHNVNRYSWKSVASHLRISLEKIFLNNVSKTGHCFGIDPFMNLKDAWNAELLKSGDFYFLITVGLGAAFSALLFRA